MNTYAQEEKWEKCPTCTYSSLEPQPTLRNFFDRCSGYQRCDSCKEKAGHDPDCECISCDPGNYF